MNWKKIVTSDNNLKIILEFLKDNPEFITIKVNKQKPTNLNSEAAEKIKLKYEKNLDIVRSPSLPETKWDPALSIILQEFYDFDNDNTSIGDAEVIHKKIKSSENFMGELLEVYIESIIKDFGWIRAIGETIKATDFIKKEDGTWHLLQIKNRNNTENSSSAKIREGTDIKKWWRFNAKNGKLNWENFPIEDCRDKLSDEGFLIFIKNYFNNL